MWKLFILARITRYVVRPTSSEYCPAQPTEHVYNVTQCPSQMNVVGHVCASHKKARLTPSRLPNCYRLSTSCTCPTVRFKLRLYQSLNNPHAQNRYKLEPCSVTHYSANCSDEFYKNICLVSKRFISYRSSSSFNTENIFRRSLVIN